jgi:DNA polymerase III delta subunit
LLGQGKIKNVIPTGTKWNGGILEYSLKDTSTSSFAKATADKSFGMTINFMLKFFYGENDFLIARRIQQIRREFRAGDASGQGAASSSSLSSLGQEVVFDLKDSGSIDWGQLEEAFQSGGLFSAKKLVILENVLALPKDWSEKLQGILEARQVSWKDSRSSLEVVVTAGGKANLKAKNAPRLVKFLGSQSQQVEEFELFNETEAAKWAVAEFQTKSAGTSQLNFPQALELARISRNNLWKINSELEKLANYRTSGAVSSEDIRLLCSGELERNVFQLIDAVGAGRPAEAIRLKNQLLREGSNEFQLFATVIGYFRNLIKIKRCLSQGLRAPAQIGQKIGVHSFVVQKALGQTTRFSSQRLKAVYEMATKLDQQAKVGEVNLKEGLNEFFVRA